MPTPPEKTPWEVICVGISTLTGVAMWFLGRRKSRREYLDYEPVPKIDFEDYKKQMDLKFQEMDRKEMVSSSAILASIQGVREDFAAMKAVKVESEKRLDRIEERINRALDRHGD